MGANPSSMSLPLPALPPTPDSSIFATGMAQENKSLTWKINNFEAVINSDREIDSQSFDFRAGDTIDRSSLWGLSLIRRSVSGWDYVGISLKLKLKPSATCQELQVKCHISVRGLNGTTAWSSSTGVIDIFNRSGWEIEFKTLACRDYRYFPGSLLVNGHLTLDVNFKMFAPLKLTQILPIQSIEEMVEEFQIQSRAKARKDLAGFLQKQVASSGSDQIKIISSEGLELTVQKCFLMARSPVFIAMLENDMLEANSGVVNLPDISFPSLQVLLLFFYVGDLLPEWSSSEVVAELTNAAAKYQMDDLLQFLDLTLGRVCNLQNASTLLVLAHRLEMKTAEKELLNFLQKNCLASTKNFIQFLEGLDLALERNDQRNAVGKRGHEGNEDDDDDASEKKKARVENEI